MTLQALRRLKDILFARFSASRRLRRYRVTPRANPAVVRRELLRHIRADLRQAGLLQQSPFARGTSM